MVLVKLSVWENLFKLSSLTATLPHKKIKKIIKKSLNTLSNVYKVIVILLFLEQCQSRKKFVQVIPNLRLVQCPVHLTILTALMKGHCRIQLFLLSIVGKTRTLANRVTRL